MKRVTALIGGLWMGTLAAQAASLKVGDPAPDFYRAFDGRRHPL